MLSWLRIVGSRIWGWLSRRRAADEDFAQELESHLEMLEQENARRGMTPEEARRAARVRLGGMTQISERQREMHTLPLLETSVQDIRYGARTLRKSPGFTSVAVLTLALGIGANTAIFTLIHGILLKPLPVAHPEELYNLGDDQECCSISGDQDGFTLFSYELYRQVRDHTPEFSEIAAVRSRPLTLSVRRSGTEGFAQPLLAQFVSGNYFRLFGVGAFVGRALTPADDAAGAAPTAVLSYRAWQTRFAGDASIVGSTLIVDRQPVTVVGIAPASFYGETLRGDPAEVWFPLAAEPALIRINSHLNQPDNFWLYAIGRLRQGVAPGQTEAHLKAEIKLWLAGRPNMSEYTPDELEKMKFTLTSASTGLQKLQVDYAEALQFLMVVSGFVLLIACANIANLLLARGTANRVQIAVRAALGASRGRLIRQAVTEGLLLAMLGGAGGVALAFAATRAILLLAFRGAEFVPIEASPSVPVLLFALGVSALTGLIFSIVPAWIGSRAQPVETMRGGGRSITGGSTLPQRGLLVLQAALSLVLLVGAGLTTETLRRLENQKFGFETRGRVMVQVDPDLAGYSPERIVALYNALQERLMQIPGVLSASLSKNSPMEGSNWGERISIAGRPNQKDGTDSGSSSLNTVSAHYFETIGTRLVRGRFIDETDTPASRHVAVVNETFARKYFPKGDAQGQHFGIGDASHANDYEIVGVVGDTKYVDPRGETLAMAFFSLLQAPDHKENIFHDIQLLVAGKVRNLQPEIQRALASVDENLTMIRAISFEEQVRRNFNEDRLVARLTALYGALALILACVGLYGVAAYTVAQRTSEIGIRIALGAPRSSIAKMVLRVAVGPVTLGLLIGLPLALAGGRAIASGLYGIKSYDPFVLGTAVLVLVASSIAAALIPARRAAKVDPMTALRYE